ncbi:Phosphate-import ATP-binding protein PhnC [bioreactor metagenome]|uniref:Phosphate-import ATP-binding protein PhnC n=1 Tax=bioreactor metagenome TaxID=1076179 RepID=A0A645FF67_9ZZZZ
MVGLEDRAYDRCSKLSGGQKQRVGIARALVQNPKMILCDEPIASLDPQSSKVIMEYLKEIVNKTKIPCLVNLHQVDVALHYSDRIIGMHAGEIVFNGKPEELTDEMVEKIYGVKIEDLINREKEN